MNDIPEEVFSIILSFLKYKDIYKLLTLSISINECILYHTDMNLRNINISSLWYVIENKDIARIMGEVMEGKKCKCALSDLIDCRDICLLCKGFNIHPNKYCKKCELQYCELHICDNSLSCNNHIKKCNICQKNVCMYSCGRICNLCASYVCILCSGYDENDLIRICKKCA